MNRSTRSLLLSFTKYVEANPGQRFWQALRNWAGVPFIYVSERLIENESGKGRIRDSFFTEKQNPLDDLKNETPAD
jgi:hypothetical protein